MKDCRNCEYRPVRAYEEPCSSCVDRGEEGGSCFKPKKERVIYLVDPVSTVHANPDYGVGNTPVASKLAVTSKLAVVDDGTAATSPHYNSLGVQPIEFMEDTLTHEEFKGFLKGNMIKYAFRAGKKDPMEKDVNKYNQYRDWYDMCCGGLRVSATLEK